MVKSPESGHADRPMTTAVTDRYVDYLRLNRDFTAPAVTAAISSITPPGPSPGPRILDAGTGAGGALTGLADLAHRNGAEGIVTAIDLDPRAVNTAQQYVDEHQLQDTVEVHEADLLQVAGEAAHEGTGYDLIWSSDVIWPGTFEDPGSVVAALRAALSPRGVLALFTTNYYQSMLLPGHSRLERLIRTASEKTWGLPHDGAVHYELLGDWMQQAELGDITLSCFPMAAASLPAGSTARAYMEEIVWPEMRHAANTNGESAGMTTEDLRRAEELLNPDSPGYIGADPAVFTLHPTLLWTGTRP